MLRQTLTITFCVLIMMLGLTPDVTLAQETGQASAREIPRLQKLSGVIRWSREMGVPPTELL